MSYSRGDVVLVLYPDSNLRIRLLGPTGTVEHYRKGFEDWLRALN